MCDGTSAFHRSPVAGIVGEDLPHRARGNAEKMQPGGCPDVVNACELEVSFMNERCSTDGGITVPSPTMPEAIHAAVVVEREKFGERFLVALRTDERRGYVRIVRVASLPGSVAS